MEKDTIIKANAAKIGYGSHILCKGISFDIRRGDCILLCGPNGSGKTTLLRAITDGSILDGQSCERVMVPTGIPKVKGFTLREFISTSLYRESSWKGRIGKKLESRIDQVLEMLALSALQGHDISTLSDGEFQKGTIAAALCRTSDEACILLDEPSSFLDPENKAMIFRTLRQIAQESGTAFVYSTHDVAAALPSCTAAWAIGKDGQFRCGRETKIEVISSIFSDKSLIFGNSTEF
ncbi:MAG: ABC transporter ATP-binding protein [Bacteroidales bacterium]|nr:ABC transporter ATP-binding protein [Bacteroidales bacterium]